MPTISRFFGIVIFMNYNDHLPPHFHARYQDQEVTVEIETGLVQGRMSRRELRMILEWSEKVSTGANDQLGARQDAPIPSVGSTLGMRAKIMFLHVKGVNHLDGYRLRILFSNGIVKDVDLSGELYGEVFEALKDPEFFKRVSVNLETETIEWPNGADFAPEFLYEAGQETKQVA